MQEESADLCSIPRRLERIRVSTQSTWAQIATKIELSESMIYQVKSGKRQLSPKSLYRLATAEMEAGIKTPLMEQIEKDGGSDGLSVLKKILDQGKWDEDFEAQFAALMGQEELAEGVSTSWSLLEDLLNAFFDRVETHQLPENLKNEIPILRSKLEGFDLDLAVLFKAIFKEHPR